MQSDLSTSNAREEGQDINAIRKTTLQHRKMVGNCVNLKSIPCTLALNEFLNETKSQIEKKKKKTQEPNFDSNFYTL